LSTAGILRLSLHWFDVGQGYEPVIVIGPIALHGLDLGQRGVGDGDHAACSVVWALGRVDVHPWAVLAALAGVADLDPGSLGDGDGSDFGPDLAVLNVFSAARHRRPLREPQDAPRGAEPINTDPHRRGLLSGDCHTGGHWSFS